MPPWIYRAGLFFPATIDADLFTAAGRHCFIPPVKVAQYMTRHFQARGRNEYSDTACQGLLLLDRRAIHAPLHCCHATPPLFALVCRSRDMRRDKLPGDIAEGRHILVAVKFLSRRAPRPKIHGEEASSKTRIPDFDTFQIFLPELLTFQRRSFSCAFADVTFLSYYGILMFTSATIFSDYRDDMPHHSFHFSSTERYSISSDDNVVALRYILYFQGASPRLICMSYRRSWELPSYHANFPSSCL